MNNKTVIGTGVVGLIAGAGLLAGVNALKPSDIVAAQTVEKISDSRANVTTPITEEVDIHDLEFQLQSAKNRKTQMATDCSASGDRFDSQISLLEAEKQALLDAGLKLK